ncbi:hypothetical protein K474DRAFT_1669006 [Panus rudis PR-1116 ss-1]|nr:hypothetical protein K474DRAFT_1669006 [Panus rudis PR-1116 ss-1]
MTAQQTQKSTPQLSLHGLDVKHETGSSIRPPARHTIKPIKPFKTTYKTSIAPTTVPTTAIPTPRRPPLLTRETAPEFPAAELAAELAALVALAIREEIELRAEDAAEVIEAAAEEAEDEAAAVLELMEEARADELAERDWEFAIELAELAETAPTLSS